MNDNFLTVTINGIELKFKTLPGVFSKTGIDLGTKLLLKHLKVDDRTVVADLGCGAGVVGIYAAKSNERAHVHLLDDHLRATELANKNIDLNNLRNIEVYLSDLFSAQNNRSYHQIFSNPPAQMGNEFLEELIKQSYLHLKPDGVLWLVVVRHLKPVIIRYLEDTFKNAAVVDTGKDHVVIKAIKKA